MMNVNVQDAWKKAVDEQSARVEAAWGEMGKLEARGAEQAKTAVEEWAKLSRESIGYGLELHAQWRQATLEATRNAFAMMAPASK